MTSGLRYDLARVTPWSVPLTWALMAADVVYLGTTLMTVDFMNRAIDGRIDPAMLTAEAEAEDTRTLIVALAYMSVLIAAYVANCIWIYRASWNARSIQPGKDRITPGWAVGWYFIPILSLWKPFTAMRETWDASSVPGGAGSLLGWWWAFWIASNILAQISARMGMRAEAFEDMRAVAYIDLATGPISIVAALLFLRIVRAITAAQADRGPAEVFA